MIFPSRDCIGMELQILIYQQGGTLREMRACDTYTPLADRFHLDAATRDLTRDDLYKYESPSSAWAN